jgi:hypothetical protein
MAAKTTTEPMTRICHLCGDASHGFYCGACSDAKNEARRNRRLIPFRNYFCGKQATHHRDGGFFCLGHFQMERMREFQDPAVTAENIRQSNIESEKRRYARLKDAGICVTCGKAPSYFGCVSCESCQAKRREMKARSLGKPIRDGAMHPWQAANNRLFPMKTCEAKRVANSRSVSGSK